MKNKRPMPTGGLSAIKRTIKKFFGYYPVLAPLTMLCCLFSSLLVSASYHSA